MAHYDLHLSEVPLEFSIDSTLRSLATKNVDLHSFEDELTIISKYADEYGPSPRNTCDNEYKGSEKNPVGERKVDSTELDRPFEEITSGNENKVGPDTTVSRNGLIGLQGVVVKEDAVILDELEMKEREQGGGKAQSESGGGEVPVVVPQSASKETPTIVQTIAKNAPIGVGEADGTQESGVAGAVPIVVGNEIAPNSEVSAFAAAIKSVKGNEMKSVAVKPQVDGEEGISVSMRDAPVSMEQAEKEEDAELALLLRRDSLVSQLASRCNISREECAFYLESTDWNLEDAIRIYDSFTG